ncbi:hypothetical protein DP42_4002 [Burkholderia pseudomallei]|nr:hypothetical protein DO73_4342 [Burkholderia pseudomallei]KGD21169.1 hypothetical protein DP42_4002 [Burkholderia pseudomallei]
MTRNANCTKAGPEARYPIERPKGGMRHLIPLSGFASSPRMHRHGFAVADGRCQKTAVTLRPGHRRGSCASPPSHRG